jgi:hypothetical protein
LQGKYFNSNSNEDEKQTKRKRPAKKVVKKEETSRKGKDQGRNPSNKAFKMVSN